MGCWQGGTPWLCRFCLPIFFNENSPCIPLRKERRSLTANPWPPVLWPRDETGRVAVLLKTLRDLRREATAKDIAARIKGASPAAIDRLAQTLATHGLIRRGETGYVG